MKRFWMSDSMKLASVWVVWGVVAIGALGWALFIVLQAFGVEGDAASWVQAVGSVGAILVAVWVSSRQQTSRDQERKRREFSYMARVIPLVTIAAGHIDTTCRRIRDGDRTNETLQGQLELLDIVKVELEQFEYSKFAADDVADGWLESKSAVAILSSAIRRSLADPVLFRLVLTDGFTTKAVEARDKVTRGVLAYGMVVGDAVWREHHP